MFGRLSERVTAVIRWGLVLGWGVLILSLFFDPVSSALNRPDNAASPFRLDRFSSVEDPNQRYACPLEAPDGTVDWRGLPEGSCDGRCPTIQGRCIVERPYPMGARLFWTIILPIVPMFLLVFGHEAWRRICPLSALMQIPRKLGIQRRDRSVNPKTGAVESRLRLLTAEGFLGRNFWYLQFGLLWLGLSLRLLFINSDRISLAVFFLAVIAIAMTVGWLFGGKAWCQYICPLSPVQKFYTEPRGLLESRAHTASGPITQSMCRTVGEDGEERSACVGCKSPCPDIDLERQYWGDRLKAGRRFFYYGYPGLVYGFYSYYAVYAGNWSYYFSGAWTHEEGQLATLLDPGFFIQGVAWPIPKVVAAPLWLALWILLGVLAGTALERVYRRHVARRAPRTPESAVQHRAFAASTFFTINLFYLFGGRPNLNLLPPMALAAVDMLIVVLSTAWLVRSWPRSEEAYERESVADTLRRQLGKLEVDLAPALGGRGVAELNADEVHALARTLPVISAEQARRAYKETLRESLQRGHAASAAGAGVLDRVREQMGVSQDDHTSVLAELGIEDPALLDPDTASAREAWHRTTSYRESLEALLDRWSREGVALSDALAREEVQEEIRRLQETYSITPEEQDQVLAELTGEGGALVRQGEEVLARLVSLSQLTRSLQATEGEGGPVARLLASLAEVRTRHLVRQGLNLLSGLSGTPAGDGLARGLGAAAGPAVREVLEEDGRSRWEDRLGETVELLESGGGSGEAPEPTAPLLDEVLHGWTPLARSAALWLLHLSHPARAREEAEALSTESAAPLREVAGYVRDGLGELPHGSTLYKAARLHEAELFRGVAPDELVRLAHLCHLRLLETGEVLFRAGEEGRELVLVNRGTARVVLAEEPPRVLATVGAGETLGELAVLAHGRRTATVVAAEPMEVLALDGEALDRVLAASGRTASGLLRLVSRRLADTLEKVSSTPPRPGPDRA